MLNEKELTAIHERTWMIDCPRILLTRRSEDAEEVVGAGSLRFLDDGLIHLKFYKAPLSTDETSDPISKIFWDEWNLPAGTLLSDEHFFDLVAEDTSGRTWKSQRIRLRQPSDAIVQATVPSIQEETTLRKSLRRDKGRSLTLHVFEEHPLPANAFTQSRVSVAGRQRSSGSKRNAWKFRACKIDFLIAPESSPNWLTIRANTTHETTKHLRERVVEAFELVQGRPIYWSVSVEHQSSIIKTEVKSGEHTPDILRHQPPLQPLFGIAEEKDGRSRLTTKYHRRLFYSFLRHTLEHDGPIHPLAIDLRAVYEASRDRFIEPQALTLVVVIESLLAREFPEMGRPSALVQRYVKQARDCIRSLKLPSDVENRLVSAVSLPLGNSATSRLRALVEKSIVCDHQRKAWTDLRNYLTHAYQSSEMSEERKRNLMSINQVLLTRLVFQVIGYKGPYTNYAKLGWPQSVFPQE